MIIRHTPLLQLDQTSSLLSELKAQLDHQVAVATTGQEVLDPSDAAGDWGFIFGLQESLDNQDQYIENAEFGLSLMETADAAYEEATTILIEATELAVQMSSEFYTDDDRASVAAQIDALYDQMLAQANVSFDGRYIFGGTAYDDVPFLPDGSYQGSTDVPITIVGDQMTIETGIVGSDAFGSTLTALENLSAALSSGPGSAQAVQGTLDELQSATDDLIVARQQAAVPANDAEDAIGVAEGLKLSLQSTLNAETAADPIEALTKLAELQSSYELALQVTASSSSMNLFSFLN